MEERDRRTKIAILSDIHGNAQALRAVLAVVRRMEIREVFVLGDFLGYYYEAREVLALLADAAFHVTAVRGNHERMLACVRAGERGLAAVTEKYGHGLARAMEMLPESEQTRLAGLPDARRVEVAGVHFLLAHGTPCAPERYVYPDAPAMVLDEAMASAGDADIVLLGHTHYPMVRACGTRLLLNPGSVGQARQRGGVADWCIVHAETGVVQPMATPYDVRPVLREVQQRDPDGPYLRDVLLRGWADAME